MVALNRSLFTQLLTVAEEVPEGPLALELWPEAQIVRASWCRVPGQPLTICSYVLGYRTLAEVETAFDIAAGYLSNLDEITASQINEIMAYALFSLDRETDEAARLEYVHKTFTQEGW